MTAESIKSKCWYMSNDDLIKLLKETANNIRSNSIHGNLLSVQYYYEIKNHVSSLLFVRELNSGTDVISAENKIKEYTKNIL